MLTPETTNANAEATQQTPAGGRIQNWATQNDQFLKGAATGGVGVGIGVATHAAFAAFDDAAATKTATNGIEPDILAHVKKNTVTIITKAYDKDGKLLTWETKTGGETDIFSHGSGAFLEGTNGRLLGTAGHVLKDNGQMLPPGATLKHFVKPNEGELAGQLLEVKTTKIDAAGNDVAILDISRTTSYTGIEFGGTAALNDTVYLFGTPIHPMHAGTLKTMTISALEGHRINTPGKGYPLKEQATEDLIQVDGIIHQGFSGGIIVDNTGRAVGIATHRDVLVSGPFNDVDETTIGFATRAERLQELKESYMQTPQFLNNSQTSGTPAGAEESAAAAAAAATQNGADTEAADATLPENGPNGIDSDWEPKYKWDPDWEPPLPRPADSDTPLEPNPMSYQQTGSGSHWKGGKKGPPNGQKETIDAAEHAELAPAALAPHMPQSATDYSGFAIEPMQNAMMQNAMCSPIHGCYPIPPGIAQAEQNVVDVDVNVDYNPLDLLEILGSLCS